MEHPSFESLLGYVENTIAGPERQEIGQHLASPCRECSRQVNRLKRVFEAVQTDQTMSPSPKVLKKAFELFKDKEKEKRPSVLSVLAGLIFDSRQQLAPALVRGGPSAKRVLLYSASPVDIDLQITPREGLNNILGQVLVSDHPDQAASAFVSIKDSQTGELVMGVESNPFGQFNLQNIPSGHYDLILELDAQEVTVPSLEI